MEAGGRSKERIRRGLRALRFVDFLLVVSAINDPASEICAQHRLSQYCFFFASRRCVIRNFVEGCPEKQLRECSSCHAHEATGVVKVYPTF